MKLIIDLDKDSKYNLTGSMLLIQQRLDELEKVNNMHKRGKLKIKDSDGKMGRLVKLAFNEHLDKFSKCVPIKSILNHFPREEKASAAFAIECLMKSGEIYMPNEDFIAKI